METLKKQEYWWLKLTIVIITLFSLSVISIQSREISQLKTQVNIDSTAYYKYKFDSVSVTIDSLNTELFIEKNNVGRYEMGLDFLKERRPNEYNLLMHYISTQTE